ncbi:hypothetical protein [Pirellulimonas nuda]|uniref:hypothetical protein n=1 Tax=Pirellulimonas nuda TaxID=2528009 RepID=UPI0011A394F5|nr:hypothetical protein [Pirellulimonas nuda]
MAGRVAEVAAAPAGAQASSARVDPISCSAATSDGWGSGGGGVAARNQAGRSQPWLVRTHDGSVWARETGAADNSIVINRSFLTQPPKASGGPFARRNRAGGANCLRRLHFALGRRRAAGSRRGDFATRPAGARGGNATPRRGRV